MKLRLLLVSSFIALTNVGCASTTLSLDDYKGAPPIVTDVVPRPGRAAIFVKNGLGPIIAQIPSYDGKGKLMASWTPSDNVSKNFTFVIVHGGHGIVGTDFREALSAKKLFNANVLILDSYWSRGTEYNGGEVSRLKLGQRIDPNDRAFDLHAAGKWLAEKGVDPTKTVIFGGSQGGWTTLRALTDDPLMAQLTKPFYSYGVSIYPACEAGRNNRWLQLGSYYGPMLILTGGRDTGNPSSDCDSKTLKTATKWIEFPDATHAFDRPNGKMDARPVDGVCDATHYAKGREHTMCHNASREREMYEEIAKLIGYKNFVYEPIN